MVRHIYRLGSIDIYIRGIIDAASSCDSGRCCMVAGGLMMECDLEYLLFSLPPFNAAANHLVFTTHICTPVLSSLLGAWESRKSWHICMTKADFK